MDRVGKGNLKGNLEPSKGFEGNLKEICQEKSLMSRNASVPGVQWQCPEGASSDESSKWVTLNSTSAPKLQVVRVVLYGLGPRISWLPCFRPRFTVSSSLSFKLLFILCHCTAPPPKHTHAATFTSPALACARVVMPPSRLVTPDTRVDAVMQLSSNLYLERFLRIMNVRVASFPKVCQVLD